MYLGKWHGCDAAVKCLNPGLFFGGGDVNNHAAVADLLKEADMLGGCACAAPLICCCTPDVRIRSCRGDCHHRCQGVQCSSRSPHSVDQDHVGLQGQKYNICAV